MNRKTLIGLSLMVLLIMYVEVCAQGYVFGPNVRVNDDPPGMNFHGTPNAGQRGVAVRGDTIHCIWRDDRVGPGIWFAKSIDGGQTFLPNVQVDDGLDYAILPTLAVGDDGTIYAAWQDRRSPYSFWQVYFSKSTDGGVTFTPDVVVNDTAGGIQNHPHRNPSMAVDSAGIIYIAFDDGRNGPGNYDIYFSRSTDGGLTFTQNVMVNDTVFGDTLNDTRPALSLSNEGDIYVSWSKDFKWLYVSKSTDGGLSFSSDVLVNDMISSSWQNSIDVDSRGYIHVLWRDDRDVPNANIYYSRSTDSGLTFSPNIRVNDAAHEPDPQAYPSMCVDDSGVVYAVWEDGRIGGLDRDIFFTCTTDNGDSSFVEPDVRITDTDSSCWVPSIAVGDSGKVYVLWMDERNGEWDVYFASGWYESGVEEDNRHRTTDIRLTIHPNPFTSVVSVKCSGIRERHTVSLKIYDMSGRLVKNFSFPTTEYQPTFTVVWDGKNEIGEKIPTGVYFVEMRVGGKEIKEKIIYLK